MKRWLAILSVCVIGAIAYLWIIPTIFKSAPVDIDDLNRIQHGMSKGEVRKILGRPSNVYKDGQIWSYSGIGWAIAYVDFDSQGNVRNVRYDP
jgi:hypothetical protein